MNRFSQIVAFSLLFFSCSGNLQETGVSTQWKFIKEIPLGGIAPIGIAVQDNFLWLSDADSNRIVKIDQNGEIIEEHAGFERPMHIAVQESQIYIPEYTSDTIRIFENGSVSTYSLNEQPEGVGGVALDGNIVAVADFYNHRIILQQGDKVSTIGKEGHNDGELYYPTDLAIHNNLIYVADAYNNRVQVFDFQGRYIKMIGWNEGINVATGLKVTDAQIIVTDFEGNRILVYDHEGKLLQILSEHFNKPTDIEIIGTFMYVVNYSGHSISLFELLQVQ